MVSSLWSNLDRVSLARIVVCVSPRLRQYSPGTWFIQYSKLAIPDAEGAIFIEFPPTRKWGNESNKKHVHILADLEKGMFSVPRQKSFPRATPKTKEPFRKQ